MEEADCYLKYRGELRIWGDQHLDKDIIRHLFKLKVKPTLIKFPSIENIKFSLKSLAQSRRKSILVIKKNMLTAYYRIFTLFKIKMINRQNKVDLIITVKNSRQTPTRIE